MTKTFVVRLGGGGFGQDWNHAGPVRPLLQRLGHVLLAWVMNQESVVGANGATINLEKVAAFEDVELTPGAADGAPGQALNVYLTDGRAVPVRGEEAVQNFVEALEGHLEAEGE